MSSAGDEVTPVKPTAAAEAPAERGSTAEKAKESPEIVVLWLPAPDGWKKKYTPKQRGTPRKNEIVFIAPTGEEINNKRQLEQYLRAHPGGPSSSDFEWTVDSPRRSSRISEKTKATGTPDDDKPKKREKTSSSKKGTKGKQDVGGDDHEVPKETGDPLAAEVKVFSDVEMKDADEGGEKVKEKDVAIEAARNAEMKEADEESIKVNKKGVAAEAAKNEDATRQDNKEKTKEQAEVDAEEYGKKNEAPEEASKVDTTVPVPESGKEEEIVEKEKPQVVLPPAPDTKELPSEEERKDGEVLSENVNRRDDQAGVTPKEVCPTYNDGLPQPKASPVKK